MNGNQPPYYANTSVFSTSDLSTTSSLNFNSNYNSEASNSGLEIGTNGNDKSIKRGKTGCITCRIRKKRCDEAKPICENCTRLGLDCMGYSIQRPSWLKAKDEKGEYRCMGNNVDFSGFWDYRKQISTERRRTKRNVEPKTDISIGKSTTKGKGKKKQDKSGQSPLTSTTYNFDAQETKGWDHNNRPFSLETQNDETNKESQREFTMEYDNFDTTSHFGSGSESRPESSRSGGYISTTNMMEPILTHQPLIHPHGNLHETDLGWQHIQASNEPNYETWTWDPSQSQPFPGEQPPDYADWSKAFTIHHNNSSILQDNQAVLHSNMLANSHSIPAQYYQANTFHSSPLYSLNSEIPAHPQQQIHQQVQIQAPQLTHQEGLNQVAQQQQNQIDECSPRIAHFRNLSDRNTSLDELWLWLLNSNSDILSSLQSPSPSVQDSLNVAPDDGQIYSNHYLNIVVPLQYRFIEYTVNDLPAPSALTEQVVWESLKSLAALHLSRHKHKGRRRKKYRRTKTKDRYNQARLSNNNGELATRNINDDQNNPSRINGMDDLEEAENQDEDEDEDEKIGKKTLEKMIEILLSMSFENIQHANSDGILVIAISVISYLMFEGCMNKQSTIVLEISRKCLWFIFENSPEFKSFLPSNNSITNKTDNQINPFYSENILLQKPFSQTQSQFQFQSDEFNQEKQVQTIGSYWKRYKIFLKSIIHLDILGSITENKASNLLPIYRFLFNHSTIDNLNDNMNRINDKFNNIIPNLGNIDNTTLLALAETVELSEWRLKCIKEGCLDIEELVKRGNMIKNLLNERKWREKRILDDEKLNNQSKQIETKMNRIRIINKEEEIDLKEKEKEKLISNCFFESTKLLLAITINGPFSKLEQIKKPINKIIELINKLKIIENNLLNLNLNLMKEKNENENEIEIEEIEENNNNNEFIIKKLIFPIILSSCYCTFHYQSYFKNLFLNINKNFIKEKEKEKENKFISYQLIIEKIWEKRKFFNNNNKNKNKIEDGDNLPINWLDIIKELNFKNGILLI
ncbi:uncharacterized protein I206_106236 [Kwoniella pini CBS 10737]|uniref:Zn(2)-C6 fungal-type domain-containing protein n=1 Tax=Kwoniella pini CBS 10737 TaxID=1296096 RepID=A0A1B9I1F2_9TREE|nr:uncharacterized protein I206_05062 [Kwoniella pini CBS 10737]OCF49369.1 hypothetical protein I206_05062 [Kwoniella pini CBS 10737]